LALTITTKDVIARKRHLNDLTGAGAKTYGGRWNHRGTALIYASETRSLAMLEFLIRVSWLQAPGDMGLATLEIADPIQSESLSPADLPEDWRLYPAPPGLADLGSAWMRSKRSLLLRVPSAIVEQEYNILINPEHPDLVRVTVLEVKDFEFDRRLLKK
jgi:RES domain-containing protein